MTCPIIAKEAGSAIQLRQPVDWVKHQSSSPQTTSSASDGHHHFTDTSIENGYNWLLSYIVKNYTKLQERVGYDSLRQTEKENKSIEDRFFRFHSNHRTSSKRSPSPSCHTGHSNRKRRTSHHENRHKPAETKSMMANAKLALPPPSLVEYNATLKSMKKSRRGSRRSAPSIIVPSNNDISLIHPLNRIRQQAADIDMLALNAVANSPVPRLSNQQRWRDDKQMALPLHLTLFGFVVDCQQRANINLGEIHRCWLIDYSISNKISN